MFKVVDQWGCVVCWAEDYEEAEEYAHKYTAPRNELKIEAAE